jgi:hypothetical protein
MSSIIERFDGEPEKVARDLVDAANRAGGKDNITAVFVAGSEFLGSASPVMKEARVRHSITRMRGAHVAGSRSGVAAWFRRVFASRAAFLIYGFVIGVVLALVWR